SHFFRFTSRIKSTSRSRSASKRLSFAFSSSNAFRRFTSAGARPEKALELLAVGARIKDEVGGPDVIGCTRLEWAWPTGGDSPTWPFPRRSQSRLAPQT